MTGSGGRKSSGRGPGEHREAAQKFLQKSPGGLSGRGDRDRASGRQALRWLSAGRCYEMRKCPDLNQYKTAITPSCMLYKGFVSRKLNPARYASPFIGRRSMELLLEQKQAELAQQHQLYEEVSRCHRIISQAAATGILSDYEAARHQEAAGRRQELENLSETRAQVQREYESLDFLYLERMRRQIEELRADLAQKDKAWHDLDKENARIQAQLENLENRDLPEAMRKIAGVRARISEEFSASWIEDTGEPRFLEIQRQQSDLPTHCGSASTRPCARPSASGISFAVSAPGNTLR